MVHLKALGNFYSNLERFADDTSLFSIVKDIGLSQNKLNEDLAKYILAKINN